MKYKTLNDYKCMKWKNGLGETLEIDIYPENSSLAELNFDYRISMAKIKTDNEFSIFPGYMRYLTILKGGNGFINDVLLTSNSIIQFLGAEKKKFKINSIEEEIIDLGIIYRPEKVDVKFLKFEDFKDSIQDITTSDKIFIINKNDLSTIEYSKKEILQLQENSILISIKFLS